MTLARILLPLVALALLATPAPAGEPTKTLTPEDARRLAWEVAPTLRFAQRLELSTLGGTATVTAGDGTRLAVVDLTVRVPAEFVGKRDLPLTPGHFRAEHAGEAVLPSAIGLGIGDVADGFLWTAFQAGTAGSVLSSALPRPQVHLQLVFATPEGWRDFEVRYALPIGVVTAPAPTPPAPPVSAPASSAPADPDTRYRWAGKSMQLPADMLRDYAVKEVVKDGAHVLSATGSVPFVGSELVLEARGMSHVTIEIDPAVGKTTLLALDFREQVVVEVLQDGTVLLDRPGVVVADGKGARWVSAPAALEGRSVFALFPAPAPGAGAAKPAPIAPPPTVAVTDGEFHTGLHRMDGSSIAVMVAPSRTSFPTAPASVDATALAAALLKTPSDLDGDLALAGWDQFSAAKRAKALGHAVVVAVVRATRAAPGGGSAKAPTVADPGALRALADVRRTFGAPTEVEAWTARWMAEVGTDGVFSWWGAIGVAVAPDGTITHVLRRTVLAP